VIVRALIRLASLAALAAMGWWIARLLGAGRRGEKPRRPRARVSEGSMVRDRVCNTFLPRSRALEAQVGDETHFFCSEACRSRFLQESGAAEPA
jgi:YHS domain-containing protein